MEQVGYGVASERLRNGRGMGSGGIALVLRSPGAKVSDRWDKEGLA